ncbi:putative Ankyrin repeat-containing domain protein [Seiridium cardinale]
MGATDCILANLPAELLLLISYACPRQRDLAAWAGTNRYFHSIINPLLYEIEISTQKWRTVFWAAERGEVGTLRHWISILNPDGSIRAPLDVYTRRPFAIDNALRNMAAYTTLPWYDLYVLGPLDQKTREKHVCCHAPLHIAAKRGHVKFVEFLLNHGADINAHSLQFIPSGLSIYRDARDRHSFFDENCVTLNALHVAIISGSVDVAKLLLRRGIDLKVTPLRVGRDSHITALHLAAAYPYPIENLSVLRMIGERPGADLDAPDVDGQTPLMYAAENHYMDFSAIEVLKDLGADLDRVVRTRDGIEASLLVALIRRIRWNAAAKLIDVGASLHVPEGQRSLLDECKRARMSVIHPEVLDSKAYTELVARVERQFGPPPESNGVDRSKPSNILKRVVNLVRR